MKRIIIVGGGAIGLGVAYHLAKFGQGDITLLERNQLTSGTSWHAAGIVGPLRATPSMTQLAQYALQCFAELEAETGMSTGYRQTGGYWLAHVPERMDELHRIASLGRYLGLDTIVKSAVELRQSLPYLSLAGCQGGVRVEEDANVNPVDLCMAYAKAARSRGVEIREQTGVRCITRHGDKVTGVVLDDGTELLADVIVLCAGAWSPLLASTVDLSLPLQAVEHMYIVTEPVDGIPDPFPVIRDLDSGIYIKGDSGGKVVIGGFEPDAKCWNGGCDAFIELPEDWQQFEPFMRAALKLLPVLEQTGVQRFMNGPESFTADTRPLIGEAPDINNLYVACGMNSVGVMSSAGVGRALADWIHHGESTSDLWEVDIARVDPLTASGDHLAARMTEAVADQFAMHWPYKQQQAGRGLRKTTLHDRWQSQGAVFGVAGGWERPLWFARNESECKLPYSVAEQPWQPIVEREAAMLKQGAVLLDLTAFGKFYIRGAGALDFLQSVTVSNMDVSINQSVYTVVLNHRAGIEADITIRRTGSQEFMLFSGGATRVRDHAMLRRLSRAADEVDVEDVTEQYAVLGIMGKTASSILQSLISSDELPEFSHSIEMMIHGIDVTATRISYIGEPGFELMVDNQSANSLFDTLIKAGCVPMGHYALNSCRLEKGFVHWGHDVGPSVTPLESGFAGRIDWKKDFPGKAALLKQRDDGVSRRLRLFKTYGHPLLLHDEPVWCDGRIVGLTTSGTKGVRTGLSLCLAMVECCDGNFSIEVAGTHYAAELLSQVPYDPDNRYRIL